VKIRLASEEETKRLGAKLAARLRAGDCIALSGELGTGKSVLARAILRALGVRDAALPSPTFSIVQEYEADGRKIAHMDWYRIADASELEAIGVREYFAPPWIVIVEWPERAPELLKQARIYVHLAFAEEPNARIAEVFGVAL